VSVVPGTTLTFSASGEVDAGTGPANGPNGAPYLGHTTDISSYGGISGIEDGSSAMFLVGVFTAGGAPAGPAPKSLDFSSGCPVAQGCLTQDFPSLSPLLDQQFFVGTGLATGGQAGPHNFEVPTGGTTLYLGFSDAVGFQGAPGAYTGSTGQLQVLVGTTRAPSGPPVITSGAPNQGTVGVAYSGQVPVSGGTAPYTWSVVDGQLPQGLSLDPATGMIWGTPTSVGVSAFSVRTTDSSPAPQSATASLLLAVADDIGTVHGTVSNDGTALQGAVVQACDTEETVPSCYEATSGSSGTYSVKVPAASYKLTLSPPSGSDLASQSQGPVTVAAQGNVEVDFALGVPQPAPPGTTVTGWGYNCGGQWSLSPCAGGVPVLSYWGSPTSVTTQGCPDGTATYVVTLSNGYTTTTAQVTGSLAETPVGSGSYDGTVPLLGPIIQKDGFQADGPVELSINVSCPDPDQDQAFSFELYVDPSGTVVDTSGNPVGGAQVTLLAASAPPGPYVPVPDGSAVMSQGNRANPSTTGASGIFGWDALAGYYEVRASAPGCTSPTDPDQGYVDSAPFEVPPPMSDIQLVLSCAQPATVDVSGSQTYGSSSPSFNYTQASGPAVTGTVRCATVNGGTPIGPSLVAQQPYTVDGPSCTGLAATGGGEVTYVGGTFAVDRATPTVTWAAPAAITYGTALGPAQLDATASVPGTFAYTANGPSVQPGEVLGAGTYTLGASFTPTDTTDYTAATASAQLVVDQASQTVTWSSLPEVGYGQPAYSVASYASVSTGLALSFSGTGPCSVTSAGVLTVSGPGTCVVTATQSGTSDYSPASASTDLTVSPVGLFASALGAQAGQKVTLTARVASNVSSTKSRLEILDQTAGKVLATCSTGSSCPVTVSYTSGARTYVAELLGPTGALTASSPTVTVVWSAPTVTLTASTKSPGVAQPVKLTAEASEPMTGTPFWLVVFDPATGLPLVACGTGATCSVTVAEPSARTFDAAIFTFFGAQVQQGPPASVSVNWPPLTVALVAKPAAAKVKGAVVLTATANGNVGPTGYSVLIVDVTSPSRPFVVAACPTGTTCQASAYQLKPGSRTYVAEIAYQNGTHVAYSSAPVTVSWS
jgi:hypothetical protein